MSVELVSAAFAQSLPHVPKFVLVALCEGAGKDRVHFTLMETLVRKVGMSERGVQKQIAELEQLGYVERQFRKGRSTVYRLTDPRTWCTPHDMHPAHGAGVVDNTPAQDAGVGAHGAGGGAPRAPITVSIPLPTLLSRKTDDSEIDSAKSECEEQPPIDPLDAFVAAMEVPGMDPVTINRHHPDWPDLIKQGTTLSDIRLAALSAVSCRKGKGAFDYALGILRNRAAKARASPPAPAPPAVVKPFKPSISDRIEGKTYVPTPEEQLAPEYRDAIAAATAAG